jgi:hypothetical protein
MERWFHCLLRLGQDVKVGFVKEEVIRRLLLGVLGWRLDVDRNIGGSCKKERMAICGLRRNIALLE